MDFNFKICFDVASVVVADIVVGHVTVVVGGGGGGVLIGPCGVSGQADLYLAI